MTLSKVVWCGCSGLIAVAIACGGTSKNRASSGDGGDDDDSSNAGAGTGNSAGAGAGSGQGGSGGTNTGGSGAVNEAGAGADGQTGGAPPQPDLPQDPTPGSIRCGGEMCDWETEICCSGMGGSGNGAGFETCSSTFCSFRRECDETADCVGTAICCFRVFAAPPAIIGSVCEEPEYCSGGDAWIGCGSQDDCDTVDAPACVAQPCGGQTIQTCGPIPRINCL